MMNLSLNPAFVHKLFDKITGFYTEVNKRILDTGYILAPTHNFQEDVPLENILSFYQESESIAV